MKTVFPSFARFDEMIEALKANPKLNHLDIHGVMLACRTIAVMSIYAEHVNIGHGGSQCLYMLAAEQTVAGCMFDQLRHTGVPADVSNRLLDAIIADMQDHSNGRQKHGH